MIGELTHKDIFLNTTHTYYHLHLGPANCLFFFRFTYQNPVLISFLPHMCYMPHPSHPPWSDQPRIFGAQYGYEATVVNNRESRILCFNCSLFY